MLRRVNASGAVVMVVC